MHGIFCTGALLSLDALPHVQDGRGRRCRTRFWPKYVRMSPYQLLVERSTYVVDVEARCAIAHVSRTRCAVAHPSARTGTAIRLNLRVKNYLFKHIAKLFLKVFGRALSNSLNRLVGLLNHVL